MKEVEEIKDILVYNLFTLLEKDQTIVNCGDNQCDDEDCVLWRATKQYMKYQFDENNKKGLSFEFLKNKQ
jgi:hypothetical protein